MGILQQFISSLIKGKVGDKAAAPFQKTSNISPQENYAGYTQLPNLSNMSSMGDYIPDPFRQHAPFQTERDFDRLVNNMGTHFYDAGDETIIGIPDQALQKYFNEGKELPPIPREVPAHGVFCPTALFAHGYFQAFVPEFNERTNINGSTPAVLLSSPITVKTIINTSEKRVNLSAARSHPPKKGG